MTESGHRLLGRGRLGERAAPELHAGVGPIEHQAQLVARADLGGATVGGGERRGPRLREEAVAVEIDGGGDALVGVELGQPLVGPIVAGVAEPAHVAAFELVGDLLVLGSGHGREQPAFTLGHAQVPDVLLLGGEARGVLHVGGALERDVLVGVGVEGAAVLQQRGRVPELDRGGRAQPVAEVGEHRDQEVGAEADHQERHERRAMAPRLAEHRGILRLGRRVGAAEASDHALDPLRLEVAHVDRGLVGLGLGQRPPRGRGLVFGGKRLEIDLAGAGGANALRGRAFVLVSLVAHGCLAITYHGAEPGFALRSRVRDREHRRRFPAPLQPAWRDGRTNPEGRAGARGRTRAQRE
jgi:hypothetical protein